MERLIAARERLVTDAEVLREILHRYAAIGRKEAIGPAVDLTWSWSTRFLHRKIGRAARQ